MKKEYKEKIKWAEKEYNKWVKNGWHGKKTKKGIEFVDFITYLKRKYENV